MKPKEHQESRSGAMVKGVASGFFVSFVAAALTLLLTPFALGYLDREEFSIFSLSNAFVVWLTVFDVGITGALTSRIAKYGPCESEERDRLVSTGVVAQNVVAALILLAGLALSFVFNGFFHVPDEIKKQSQLTVVVLAIAAAITACSKSYIAVLQANRFLYLRNTIQLGVVCFRTLLVVLLLIAGAGLISLSIGTLISSLFGAVFSVLFVRWFTPYVKIHRSLASWQTFREIRGLGIWFFLNSLAILLLHSVDRIAVAKIVSLSSVVSFTLTGQIYNLLQKNIGGVTNVAWPLLAEGFGRREVSATYRMWLPLLSVSLGASFVSASTIWASNGVFVTWWVGEVNYAGIRVDTLFAIYFLSVTAVFPYRAALTGAGVLRAQAILRVVEAVLFLALCLPLGFAFGMVGIAASLVISTIATSLVLIPRITAFAFQISYGKFILDNCRMVLVLGLCSFPFAFLGRFIADYISGLTGAVVSALITFVFSSILTLFFGFESGVRHRILSLVRRRARLGSPSQ